MTVKLHSKANAGRSVAVGTTAGRVGFDRKGDAEVSATADDLVRYSALGWVVSSEITEEEARAEAQGLSAPREEVVRTVQLHSEEMRGRSVAVGTLAGRVEFDRKGDAEVEATESDIVRYASIGWLVPEEGPPPFVAWTTAETADGTANKAMSGLEDTPPIPPIEVGAVDSVDRVFLEEAVAADSSLSESRASKTSSAFPEGKAPKKGKH